MAAGTTQGVAPVTRDLMACTARVALTVTANHRTGGPQSAGPETPPAAATGRCIAEKAAPATTSPGSVFRFLDSTTGTSPRARTAGTRASQRACAGAIHRAAIPAPRPALPRSARLRRAPAAFSCCARLPRAPRRTTSGSLARKRRTAAATKSHAAAPGEPRSEAGEKGKAQLGVGAVLAREKVLVHGTFNHTDPGRSCNRPRQTGPGKARELRRTIDHAPAAAPAEVRPPADERPYVI